MRGQKADFNFDKKLRAGTAENLQLARPQKRNGQANCQRAGEIVYKPITKQRASDNGNRFPAS